MTYETTVFKSAKLDFVDSCKLYLKITIKNYAISSAFKNHYYNALYVKKSLESLVQCSL